LQGEKALPSESRRPLREARKFPKKLRLNH